jgi:hypothetical protein
VITPAVAIALVIIGAFLGAGTVALCVAARRGDDDADVALYLASISFSSVNQGRDVQLNRHDFNRMAQLAAKSEARGRELAEVLKGA